MFSSPFSAFVRLHVCIAQSKTCNEQALFAVSHLSRTRTGSKILQGLTLTTGDKERATCNQERKHWPSLCFSKDSFCLAIELKYVAHRKEPRTNVALVFVMPTVELREHFSPSEKATCWLWSRLTPELYHRRRCFVLYVLHKRQALQFCTQKVNRLSTLNDRLTLNLWNLWNFLWRHAIAQTSLRIGSRGSTLTIDCAKVLWSVLLCCKSNEVQHRGFASVFNEGCASQFKGLFSKLLAVPFQFVYLPTSPEHLGMFVQTVYRWRQRSVNWLERFAETGPNTKRHVPSSDRKQDCTVKSLLVQLDLSLGDKQEPASQRHCFWSCSQILQAFPQEKLCGSRHTQISLWRLLFTNNLLTYTFQVMLENSTKKQTDTSQKSWCWHQCCETWWVTWARADKMTLITLHTSRATGTLCLHVWWTKIHRVKGCPGSLRNLNNASLAAVIAAVLMLLPMLFLVRQKRDPLWLCDPRATIQTRRSHFLCLFCEYSVPVVPWQWQFYAGVRSCTCATSPALQVGGLGTEQASDVDWHVSSPNNSYTGTCVSGFQHASRNNSTVPVPEARRKYPAACMHTPHIHPRDPMQHQSAPTNVSFNARSGQVYRKRHQMDQLKVIFSERN